MKRVKIIGVPEHFNLPWHWAIEEGAFEQKGIELIWEDIPEGTGKMAQMLADEKTDLAIILTEGLIKSIINDGNASKIVQNYIQSPLIWGIHVAANSNYQSVTDLEGKSAAISRFGSGSHLMSYINAQNQHWDTNKLTFEVINNLKGALEAMPKGQGDYFLWELFTTKPYVDKGIFRRVGNCPTPWPCFMIAATDKFIANDTAVLKQILDIINTYTREFKQIPSIDRSLANRYQLELEDIKEWLSITQWSQQLLTPTDIKSIQEHLLQLNILDRAENYDNLVVSLK